MILEVRTYRARPGRRAEFMEFFRTRSVPELQAYGIQVLGPWIDLEHPDTFLWMQGFPSLAERERMKAAFYGGRVWKDEIAPVVMPMLEEYSVALCEAPGGAGDPACRHAVIPHGQAD